MLNAVIRIALRHRLLVLLLSLILLVYGGYQTTTMPIDVFPDLDRPRVVIITECPGLAAEEVEMLVTQPIEIALLGAVGVQAVRSQTTAGLNVIYIEFDWATEIRAARQTVQERLTTLDLPEGIRPQMTPPASIMGQIVIAGVYRQRGPRGGTLVPLGSSGNLAEFVPRLNVPPEILAWHPNDRHNTASWSPLSVSPPIWAEDSEPETGSIHELVARIQVDGTPFEVSVPSEEQERMSVRTIADWEIRPQLLKLPGIAEIFVQGGDRKQYQILVNPEALLQYDVTLRQVEEALAQSNLNTSGGFAITGETERPIRILGRLGPDASRVIQDLRKVPVKFDMQRPVLLEDVAQVTEGAQLKRGDGSINGEQGAVFTIVKQPHIDTCKLTDEIAAALAEVEESLTADLVINSDLFRLRNFIDRGIFNVGEALVIGAILVTIILTLFLLNLRTTIITLTAIPLSLAITTLVFRLLGQFAGTHLSINVMTLGGIAVAMGELVDDAIVDVENIFRRLKENHFAAAPKPVLVVVYEASQEIRSAIVFGTAVVILVFLPLFSLSGIEGRLFVPLGFAYIVSILASLMVSLTVTPVLSYYLLPQAPATHRGGDGFIVRVLKRGASYLIRTSMAIPGWLLAMTWLMVAFAAWELTQLGRDFLPQFDEGSILVNVTLPPGSSLDASNQVSRVIDIKFRERQKSPANPEGSILHFVRRTGRAELDEHAAPVNAGEYILSINPDAHHNRERLTREILQELRDEVPGVDIEVEQPLAHLISHMVSGVYAQIAIKIIGDDLDVLLSTAEQVKRSIQNIPGLTPPVIEPIQQTPELHIRLKPNELARYGLTREYVGRIMQTALQGEVTSQVLEGARRYDLLIRLERAYRTDYANLGRLRIDLPFRNGQVELSALADIGEGIGPNAINRENARRRVVIRCNTQDRDLAGAVQEIQHRVKQQVEIPKGYFVEFGGQFESQQRATRTIAILAVVAVFGMFAVLLLLFPSVPIVLQILNALPTAFIGGVLGLVWTGQSLTVASLVGFISLGGIAVRNGILLVTHYFHLMHEEQLEFGKDLILRGSLERLSPVLMTAFTAGIGLVPLVWGGDEPGREILYPVATVILGGLVTSTFCEFLIHPGLFLAFSGKDAKRVLTTDRANVDLGQSPIPFERNLFR